MWHGDKCEGIRIKYMLDVCVGLEAQGSQKQIEPSENLFESNGDGLFRNERMQMQNENSTLSFKI